MHSTEEDLERSSSRRHGLTLGALVLLFAALRVWAILHYPEPDTDVPGHLGIAAALLEHPLRVDVHWVYPPGYHYFLAGLLALGVTAQGVRLLNCALTALLPLLVWRYGESTVSPSASPSARLAPFLAGALCAVMPIVNLLGTSAQQETLFTLLVLGSVWSLDSGRFARGGALLAVAAMVRYEACGAVALLAGLRLLGFFPALVRRLPPPVARACRLPAAAVVPGLVAMAGWLLAHRLSDGTWLGFLRELYRFTHIQRDSFHQDRWTDLVWFPVMQPYYLFGLALPLFLLGLRRAWRDGFVIPLGIYLFLLASYTFKCALGSGRYYESLTPFVCVSAAYGASVIGERWRAAFPVAYGAAFAHVLRLLAASGGWMFRHR